MKKGTRLVTIDDKVFVLHDGTGTIRPHVPPRRDLKTGRFTSVVSYKEYLASVHEWSDVDSLLWFVKHGKPEPERHAANHCALAPVNPSDYFYHRSFPGAYCTPTFYLTERAAKENGLYYRCYPLDKSSTIFTNWKKAEFDRAVSQIEFFSNAWLLWVIQHPSANPKPRYRGILFAKAAFGDPQGLREVASHNEFVDELRNRLKPNGARRAEQRRIAILEAEQRQAAVVSEFEAGKLAREAWAAANQ